MRRPALHLFRSILALALLAAVPALGHAQNLTISEPGFVGIQLDEDISKQVEVEVSDLDKCVYYGEFDGVMQRCQPFLPSVVCDPTLTFVVGIAFSTGGSFGSYIYVADYGAGDIHRAPGCEDFTPFATITDPGAIAFPPSGSAYGDYLYACTSFSGPIYRVSPAGAVTTWLNLATIYLRFGPGGATWGSGLYATDNQSFGANRIVKISSAGAITPLATGFMLAEGFDWGFDGDMFATDPIAGVIKRVKPDGTTTTFATLAGAADCAYRASEDALYVVSNQSGLYRIARGSATAVSDGGRTLSKLAITPNPASGPCTLRFATGASGVTRVEIVDVTGRVIRRVSEAWRTGDEQTVNWDGRDEGGTRVAPGTYFARVRGGVGDTQSARVSIVN